jgi:ribonuclease BN (tRNA processing enzyme)
MLIYHKNAYEEPKMKIRVLGCHGSQLINCNTTSFLLGQNILVDAGTVTTVLSLKEQLKINYIFITHAHLDHVRDIMFLADNVCYQRREKPLVIFSTKGIIKTIHRHLFNDVIWPDFSRIPSPKSPLIKFQVNKPGKKQKIADLQVRAIDVHHVVETIGYVIESKDKAVIFLGDTGPTEEAWQVARKTKGLKAIFIETSLPDDMKDIADRAGHLTPLSLAAELKKLKGAKPAIYLYHMKPSYHEAIRKEVAAIKDRKIHIIEDGQIIHI